MLYISLNHLFGQMNVIKAELLRTDYLFFKKMQLGYLLVWDKIGRQDIKLTHIYSESIIQGTLLDTEANM